jgi:hypothetical protein
MPLDQLTPEVWAGKLLSAFKTSLRYAQPGVCNTDYEGEITEYGDQVHVTSIGDPTITTYVKNTDLSSPETLTDGDSVLMIDQAKSYNFYVDSIDAKQNKPDAASEGVDRAGYGIAKGVDSFMASLYTDISASNQIGSDGAPITGTWAAAGTMAYDRLVDMSVLLDQNDVPEEGRWVIVPPWFEGYLLKDARFVGFGTVAQDDRLRNGAVGRAAGFTVLKSNQVPNTAAIKYKIIAGVPDAWSFAGDLTETETYKPEKRFGLGFKGLYVYGGKVMRPYALALMTANPT